MPTIAVVKGHEQGLLPYDAQPEGNIFLSPSSLQHEIRRIKQKRLGSFVQFNDQLLLELLSFHDCQDLVSLSMTSKHFYALCHHNELWRVLTLKTFFNTGFNFKNNWKDTYAFNKKPQNFVKYQPISVPHLYSDFLYRSWLCNNFSFEQSCEGFTQHADIPKLSCDALTIEEFISRFELKNQPVVITDLVTKWPAYTLWNEKYLSEQCGDSKLKVTSTTTSEYANLTMNQYFNYAKQTSEEAPLYLFDKEFGNIETLKEGRLTDDYDTPTYFRMNSDSLNDYECKHISDLFSLFGLQRRPDFRWLVCGPPRSGSIFHLDPNQTHAWNACIAGRKKWIFYPPGVCPPGVKSSPDGADVAVPVSIGEWLLNFWDDHLKERNNPIVSRRPLEIIVEPGEIIFVPHNWWHMVINLDDSGVNVAITQNYVSTTNLLDCLKFLKTKKDQISGLKHSSLGYISNELVLTESNMFNEFTILLKKLNVKIVNDILAQAENYTRGVIEKKRPWSLIQLLEDHDEQFEVEKNRSDRSSQASFSFNFFDS